MSLVTEEIRSKSEVHRGSEVCQEQSRFLLGEMGLPTTLLPPKEVECGYVPETGFVWLKQQKKKTVHKFGKIGKLVSYETEVTAYVEKNRMKKLTNIDMGFPHGLLPRPSYPEDHVQEPDWALQKLPRISL